MAKFCTNCGKPLEEGKKCNCKKVVSKNEVLEQGKETVRNYGNLFFDITKEIFVKPIDAIKKYATEKNTTFSLIALFINSLIFGIYLYVILNESVGSIASMFGYGFYGMSYKVSFLSTVLQGTLFMGTWFIVMASMMFIFATPLLKSNLTYKKAISLTGITSIFTLITTVLAFVLSIASMKLSFIIIGVSAILYLIFLVQGIMEISNINKNKIAYLFVAALIVTFISIIYILPNILY